MRSFFAFSGLFAFCPFDGGSDELPGVLGGELSLRFKFRHAGRKSLVLLRQNLDLPVLLHQRQNQRDEFLPAERIECLGGHPELESARDSCVNRAATVIQNALGVSSYQRHTVGLRTAKAKA